MYNKFRRESCYRNHIGDCFCYRSYRCNSAGNCSHGGKLGIGCWRMVGKQAEE
jgi:hypothetical protein